MVFTVLAVLGGAVIAARQENRARLTRLEAGGRPGSHRSNFQTNLPAVGPDAPESSEDNVRRLLYARQALDLLLEPDDRRRVDDQFRVLGRARTEAQAQVQRLFDMGVTMEMLRTNPSIDADQIATIEAWVGSGVVLPPR
jgi:hypothetical protein